MKEKLITTAKNLIENRSLLGFFVLFWLISLGFIIYSISSVEASDVLIWSRYTSFGETHYYRDKWYGLISWPIFGILTSGLHTIIALKFLKKENVYLSYIVILFGIVIMIVAWKLSSLIFGLPN